MKILSTTEGHERLERTGWNQVTESSLKKEFSHRLSYLLPVDSGAKTVLARRLKDAVNYSGEGLLWIDGHGVWPSSENMALFEAYRKFLGENRSLNEAPFHLFGEPDSTELECLLDLVLYFVWDAILLEGTRSRAVRISHDEYIDFYARDREALADFERALSGLDLKQIASMAQ